MGRDAASAPARRRLALASSSRADRAAQCAALHARTLCAPRLARDTLSTIAHHPHESHHNAPARRDAAGPSAHRHLALASDSRADRTASCASHFVSSTLRATLRTRHIARRPLNKHTHARHERPDTPRRCSPFSPPAPHTRLRLAHRQHLTSLLLAARRGDAHARRSRPLGRPPRSRRLDTRPPLDAAACASCAERGASLAPCSSARSHARGRKGSTAARRRVAAARRSSRRYPRALLATSRSAAAFAMARHSATARRGGICFLR